MLFSVIHLNPRYQTSGSLSGWTERYNVRPESLVTYPSASVFRLWSPNALGVCVISSVTPHPEWSPLCPLKHTRIQTTAMTHHSNNSVRDHMKWVSGSLFISRITITVALICHFPLLATPPPKFLLAPCLCEGSCHLPLYSLTCYGLCCQAGLLGCEAVLSSMALMQANNMPSQKKMSSMGQGHRSNPGSHQTHSQHSHNHHGHQAHHGQAHHSHMGHPSGGSLPPLVREIRTTALVCLLHGKKVLIIFILHKPALVLNDLSHTLHSWCCKCLLLRFNGMD